jgi:hypothetical protein
MNVQPTEVVKDFIQNIVPGKLESAARHLVAENSKYISLSFENAELKQILPCTGTSTSPEAFIFTSSTVLKLSTIEELTITDIFGGDEDVAVFGSFRLRSVSIGKVVRSQLAIHAKVCWKDCVLPVLRGHVCDRAQALAGRVRGPSRRIRTARSTRFSLVSGRDPIGRQLIVGPPYRPV